VVRPEQIEQLVIGQTPDQVTFILGSPLLTGEQTQVRWVYPIYDSATGFSNLMVYFSDGRLVNIEQN
jgi:outer membrane protein assembly factor BamE|tara:strand:- start:265 stop:465 length:201 start_codon:yes stop_codon:yes gene_type:complete